MPVYNISKSTTDKIRSDLLGDPDRVQDGASIAEGYLPSSSPKNPKFDPRITAKSDAGGLHNRPYGGLLRGRIMHVREETAPTINGQRFAAPSGPVDPVGFEYMAVPKLMRRVDFLYNPRTINTNYGINSAAFPSISQNKDDTSPRYSHAAQAMSWSLMFNRMYEVASETDNMGVLADVQALEYLMGTKDATGIQASEVLVVFGVSSGLKPFAYTGYISNLSVDYTHFSHRMIPTVAIVQIGLERRLMVDTDDNSTAPVNPQAPPPTIAETVANTLRIVGGVQDVLNIFHPRTSAPTPAEELSDLHRQLLEGPG